MAPFEKIQHKKKLNNFDKVKQQDFFGFLKFFSTLIVLTLLFLLGVNWMSGQKNTIPVPTSINSQK